MGPALIKPVLGARVLRGCANRRVANVPKGSEEADLSRKEKPRAKSCQPIGASSKAYPYVTLSDTEADDLANRFGEKAEDLQHVAALLLFLKQRLIDTELDPMEVVA